MLEQPPAGFSELKEETKTKLKPTEASLKASEKAHGLRAPRTLEIVEQKAGDAFGGHEYDRAEALYKRLLVSSLEIHTLRSKVVLKTLGRVAEVAIRRGRLVEATGILNHVREIQLESLKASSPKILELTERIASLYMSRGLHNQALTMLDSITGQDTESMHHVPIRVLEMKAIILRLKGKRANRDLERAEIWTKLANERRRETEGVTS